MLLIYSPELTPYVQEFYGQSGVNIGMMEGGSVSAGSCNPVEVTLGECHLLYFLHRPSIRGIAPHFILSISSLQVPAIMFLM